jgi:hypothetical protein
VTTDQLILLCPDIGLRLEPCDDRLLVVDERHHEPYIPSELFLLLVEHRDEIRDRLRAVHLCKQILCGEFDGADRLVADQVAVELQALAPSPIRNAALLKLVQMVKP